MIEGSWSGAVPLTNGSGSRRPKYIRIYNTGFPVPVLKLFSFLGSPAPAAAYRLRADARGAANQQLRRPQAQEVQAPAIEALRSGEDSHDRRRDYERWRLLRVRGESLLPQGFPLQEFRHERHSGGGGQAHAQRAREVIFSNKAWYMYLVASCLKEKVVLLCHLIELMPRTVKTKRGDTKDHKSNIGDKKDRKIKQRRYHVPTVP